METRKRPKMTEKNGNQSNIETHSKSIFDGFFIKNYIQG